MSEITETDKTPEKWIELYEKSNDCDMLYDILRTYHQRLDKIHENDINGMYPTNAEEAEFNEFVMDYDIQKLNFELDHYMEEAIASEEYSNHIFAHCPNAKELLNTSKRQYYLTSEKDKQYRIEYKKKLFDCRDCGKRSVNLNHRSRHNRSFHHKFRKGIIECTTLAEFMNFMK